MSNKKDELARNLGEALKAADDAAKLAATPKIDEDKEKVAQKRADNFDCLFNEVTTRFAHDAVELRKHSLDVEARNNRPNIAIRGPHESYNITLDGSDAQIEAFVVLDIRTSLGHRWRLCFGKAIVNYYDVIRSNDASTIKHGDRIVAFTMSPNNETTVYGDADPNVAIKDADFTGEVIDKMVGDLISGLRR